MSVSRGVNATYVSSRRLIVSKIAGTVNYKKKADSKIKRVGLRSTVAHICKTQQQILQHKFKFTKHNKFFNTNSNSLNKTANSFNTNSNSIDNNKFVKHKSKCTKHNNKLVKHKSKCTKHNNKFVQHKSKCTKHKAEVI